MSNRLGLLALLVGLLAVPSALAGQQQTASERDVAAAAEAWLKILDAGEYRETWNQAAPLFRTSLTAEQWEAAARPVRERVGALVSRTVQKVTPTTTLPNAPAGEYMVVEFSSVFQGLPRAVETVVMRREAEREWRVVGAMVRPA